MLLNALFNSASQSLHPVKPLPTLAVEPQIPSRLTQSLKRFTNATTGSATSAAWLKQTLFKFFHNGFAMLGLALVLLCIVLIAKPTLMKTTETQLLTWLQSRQSILNLDDYKVATSHKAPAASVSALEAILPATEPDASERATATNPADLPKQQAAVAFWISKKYAVAPEPIASLVAEAYALGAKVKLDPMLILAIMAIESRFNPFAQSPVGAQGLMQVMTKIHSDKYETFGGKLAAFDPLTNLRVGVKVLQESITRAGGNIQGGLKQYVGAANLPHDDGYGSKVLAEYDSLHRVATGKPAPVMAAPMPAILPMISPAATVDNTFFGHQPASSSSPMPENKPEDKKGELLAKL